MTADILAGGAGVILMLLFAYVPKLNTWYAGKEETYKKLFMLALLVVVAGSAFGLACAGVLSDLFGLALTCDKPGALGVIRALIVAIIANQGTFLIAPTAKAVKDAKTAR
jgi:hypothetical protein